MQQHDWGAPFTLEDERACLLPMTLAHESALVAANSDNHLSTLWFTSVPSEEEMPDYLEKALAQQAQYSSVPFVVFDKALNQVVGSTRFCNMDASNKRVEIGYTWYAKKAQRTGLNTHVKLLMLQHAFLQWRCIAVEFRTHWHNLPSRRAIARLGARQDGVLRNHQVSADGVLRDTVVFSITREEWPACRTQLNFFLQQSAV